MRSIILGDDPRLRQKTEPVELSNLKTVEFQHEIDELIEIMQNSDGLGLAAIQVGIPKKYVIVLNEGKPLCLINPLITKKSSQKILAEEGCLSFPGVYGKVARHKSIELKAHDRYGKSLALAASGLDAQAIQHELDHLAGILLPDLIKMSVASASSSSPSKL